MSILLNLAHLPRRRDGIECLMMPIIGYLDHRLLVECDKQIWQSVLEAEREPEKEENSSKPKSRPKSKQYRIIGAEQRSSIVAAARASTPHKKIATAENLPVAVVRRVIGEAGLSKKRPSQWDYTVGRSLGGDRGSGRDWT